MTNQNIAISFEHVSKMYRLGLVGTGTLGQDLNRWWKMNVLRQDDPYLKVGQTNERSVKGEGDFVYALQNIDFKIQQGDVVGIIGQNGAGKSTLLKLLSRITAPTTGQIKARGRLASLLEVGTGFHPELTGRENIYMNGSIMGMTKREITSKLDAIVDFAGIERYIDTPTKRYSSGMQVRLGFAVAAFLEPEILVVDEVLAVGDAEFQKKAIAKMQDVSSGDGRTVLFVSHNMGSVRKLCHNGVVLKNGMVDFIGSVNDAVDHYLIDYTDSLSRSVVINSDKHRKKKNLGLELEVIEVTLDDKPTELSSDEPIGMTIKLKRNSKKIKSASLNIILHDAISDIRLFNFHAPSVDLPEDTEYFSVHVLLKNHNLKKRLITFDVEACGRNDVNSYIFADQVSRVLSFEMKYKSKQKNVLWTESWGLVDFDGDNYIDVEILK